MKLVRESLIQKLNENQEPVFNRHIDDFTSDFTIEFDVKNPNYPEDITEEIAEYEWEAGNFTNQYAQRCVDEISDAIDNDGEGKDWYISDWSFAGRFNGWFVLICEGDQESVTEKELSIMEDIVQKYYKNFGMEMARFYFDKNNRK